jgi:hypothetical protein
VKKEPTMQTQFYVEVPETYPRTYQLADTLPSSARSRGYQFAPAPEFIVHSRMHGSHDKPQPYVLRGVSRAGRLLVQALVETEYEKLGSWHEIDGEYTTEGYRFKRYALKPLLTLVKLATTAQKVRARVEVQTAKLSERAEKCGTCPVCFGDYVVTNRLDSRQFSRYAMVHHGYERPGIGYIVGDCHGVNFEPIEVSCDGTISWRAKLQQHLARTTELLAILDQRDSVMVRYQERVAGSRPYDDPGAQDDPAR